MIERDSPACNNMKPYNITLKLSGCGEEEFTCSDGQCIDINKRCDQIVHCRDESDEEDCRLLVLKKGYNKNIIPFTVAPVGGGCRIQKKSLQFCKPGLGRWVVARSNLRLFEGMV